MLNGCAVLHGRPFKDLSRQTREVINEVFVLFICVMCLNYTGVLASYGRSSRVKADDILALVTDC